MVRSNKLRIANLRKNYGGLIGTRDNNEDKAQNPFTGLHPEEQSTTSMSLSVYNRPASLYRPKTAKENILQGIKGLEVQEVDENGVPIGYGIEEKDSKFPEFNVPPNLRMLARTHTEQTRLQTMVEMN